MLSGGVDSTVAAWWSRAEGLEVLPISIEYAGRPRRELEAVEAIARAAGLPPVVRMPMPFVAHARDLPAYRDPAKPFPYGYIPLRNLIFYTLAAYHADAHGARFVVGGHLVDDALAFPDANLSYFDDLNRILARSTDGWSAAGPPEIVLPFSGMKKEEVLRVGAGLHVPYDLTWSCWLDGDAPCGTCTSCKDRAEGFQKAQMEDPALR
jgi:7-cyano-7-deazaguanine synthase